MNKVLKVILIGELILFLAFIVGYLIYSSQYDDEDYSKIRQPQIAVVNESGYNITINLENEDRVNDSEKNITF